MTFSSGASVAIVASIRTWSLPLPVQPWAIVSQPESRAASTASFAISGRPGAGNSGEPPRDQRRAERREQRVAAAVQRVRLDRRQDVVLGELLARVDHDAVERAELDR